MPASVSNVFELLEGHPAFLSERHELSMGAFGALRRNVRSIVVNLREGSDHEGCEAADQLRNALSEWLTVPVLFDEAIPAALQAIGNPSEVEARWGRDIRVAFDSALKASQSLLLLENPVREKLRALIRELSVAGRPFKIYCHRKARARFESLFNPTEGALLGGSTFLHSVRDYRDSDTFDTLIKVGPLRSWGWGSAPDAIKTAPRFVTFVQIVWAGCADEPGFGYDPVAPTVNEPTPSGSPAPDDGALVSRISWTARITRSGDIGSDANGHAPEQDELQVFGRLNLLGQKRRATLVQIDEEHGILYPPHSQVLSFDPTPGAQTPVWPRLPGETLVEGMFVVRPILGNVDLGGQLVEFDHYSRTWKARLSEERQRDHDGLTARLRAAGLDLRCLRVDIRNWCVASTTVIHAPLKKRHFEALIKVLGVGSNVNGVPGHTGIPWWQSAWDEIRCSRGEASQAGRHGQDIVQKELTALLNVRLPEIRQQAALKSGFSLQLPSGQSLHGAVLFNQVSLVEEGFLAPETELHFVRELNTIEQWRA